jgi:CheY-like chemotaxis protein
MLVVDDEDFVRELLGEILEGEHAMFIWRRVAARRCRCSENGV